MQTLRDQACIVGVGETAYTRGSQKSVLRLVLEASRHAMADAGVTAHAIDGFVLPGPYLFQEQLACAISASTICATHVAKICMGSFISDETGHESPGPTDTCVC